MKSDISEQELPIEESLGILEPVAKMGRRLLQNYGMKQRI